jgi:hypothetical protein
LLLFGFGFETPVTVLNKVQQYSCCLPKIVPSVIPAQAAI